MKLFSRISRISLSDKKAKPVRKDSFFAVLFSVLVALLLWFYVQDAEAPDYKKTFSDVPVQMQSLSSSFSVIDGGENTVDITLVGKRSDLNKIRSSDLEAYVDLSSVTQPGSYQQEIQVLVPRGTEFAGSFPKLAEVFVDQTISVSVPVSVEMGEYTVSGELSLEAVPQVDQIQVKGPKSLLDQIAYAKIKTGKLGEITASFESNLEYTLYDKNDAEIRSRYVITPEKNISVKFSVYKTKSVALTLDTKYGYWKDGGYKVSISPEKILIKGEPLVVDSLESISVQTVDETTVDATRLNLSLSPEKIKLPEGCALAETLGDVKVNVTLSDNGSRNFKMKLDSGHVAVTPPANGLQYSFQDTALSFKIRGSYQTLHTAKEDDFYLNIDLSSITAPGEMEVPVEIVQTTATEGKFYPVGRYSIKVTVSPAEG